MKLYTDVLYIHYVTVSQLGGWTQKRGWKINKIINKKGKQKKKISAPQSYRIILVFQDSENCINKARKNSFWFLVTGDKGL